jgi:hypothetical protein
LLTLHPLQRVAQEVDRDVDRNVALRLEQREQPDALTQLPAPRSISVRPSVRPRRSRGHGRAMAREDRRFGAVG